MSGCAICGQEFFPPTGALCAEHEAVTDEFTDAQWKRVDAMPQKQADAYLRKRADYRRKTRGEGWWES